jgi:hypothetical protein
MRIAARRSLAVSVMLLVLAGGAPAADAQTQALPIAANAVTATPLFAAALPQLPVPRRLAAPSPLRPVGPSPLLTSLQVGFGALQVLDVTTTMRALGRGHEEANPLMRGVAGHSLALTSVKAGAAVSTLLLANRVARKNRAAAIVMMAAVNSAYAVVVANNVRAGR